MTEPTPLPNAASHLSAPEIRALFANHFGATHGEERGRKWDELWQNNFTPWDQGEPNPALVDLVDSSHPKNSCIPGPVVLDGQGNVVRRRRALVPGCGKGYDVLLFAAKGYDAVGLEYSAKAVEQCEAERRRSEENGWEVYKAGQYGKGRVMFLEGDFFAKEWQKDQQWDLIYDYTFLCAMEPSMRPAWARRMSELLTRDGRLVCLEFPLYKDTTSGGPPWGLTPGIYAAHLGHPGLDIPYGEDRKPDEDEVKKLGSGEVSPLERTEHWQPDRTFKLGQGTDYLSIWKKVD
ncbi:S-adenosyl-L-methionine-dependent methyltransferase [Eremomyces bilateralis CBS 781.70]|uniref:S-adenosyl-L-methionine-dependent methyltransferase n=1 Tax=Eremomyces bilateralis CBS 781.70 TaxID=1392243 RepID=A0A6G1G5X4_9PEZI|nr:S-adenosyl-L-methionine-dependent methyltransferase [Eremomyces bilateralis CBS 781.70]KAF1813428.1 S-adenosyl-L-methionine-dependent methyltransferase [Eremomyces bilateralis CBS 781.70]